MLLGILYAGGWKEIFLNIFGSLSGDLHYLIVKQTFVS